MQHTYQPGRRRHAELPATPDLMTLNNQIIQHELEQVTEFRATHAEAARPRTRTRRRFTEAIRNVLGLH